MESVDKVLVVMGASSGIGAATARAAAAAGFRLVLAARTEPALRELAAELGGDQRALAVRCDVRDHGEIDSAIERALDRFGQIDAVFAGAGVGAARGFRNDSVSRWREVVECNVLGTALTIRAAVKPLSASNGHLVLMGSTYARGPAPGSLYSATKRAVAALAEAARLELGGSGVRVTLIEAGTTDTPFFDNPQADALQADDVARAAVYALTQPPHVDASELVLRATAQR
jgi:NADP-dependent 3-hydroxy acid dehydrogenase YdfG